MADFVDRTTEEGFGGTNSSINNRLDNSFNQWTHLNNDTCGYVNQMRILRKPMKYYVNRVWAPSPTNEEEFSTFTSVGNQKSYNVRSNITYPGIGNLTTSGNRRFLQYVMPLNTSPDLANNAINISEVNINSDKLNFGIGELTNQNNLTKDVTTAADYNRWDFVDPKIVQNPKNIIFADGVVPRGGISTRGELRNYMMLNSC